MNEDRLAQAWPHLRAAIDILILGTTECHAQPQAAVPAVTAGDFEPNRREALVAEIRQIFDEAEPAGSESRVRVSVDKIPGGVQWGVFSEIARELSVSPQAVRRVAHGLSVSKRISKALASRGVEVFRQVEIGDAA